ncbi:MAG: beta strand repeat-containing protein, partial [Thermoguttaceae bacterium]
MVKLFFYSAYMLGGGPGTLTVASALSGPYSVTINGNVALAATIDCTGDLTVNGLFDVEGNNVAVAGLWGNGIVQNSSTPATLTVGGDGESSTFNGTLQDDGNLGLAIFVTGDSTVTLGGTNNITGATTIDSGSTLVAASNSALSKYSTLDVDGTADLAGYSCAVSALTDDNGAGLVTNNGPGTTSILTIDQGGSSYVGTIQDGNGPLGVVMDGENTQAFAGYGNYTAGTNVACGTFVITTAEAMPQASALAVGAGGTFTFDPSYGLSPQTSDNTGTQQNSGGLDNTGGTAGEAGGTPAPQDVPPVLTAIRCASAEGPLVDSNSVVFEVDFNKDVTAPATSDFIATGIGGAVSAVSGSGCQYFVIVSGVAGSGPLGLALVAAGNSITDEAGTPLAALATIVVDQQYTIDRQLFYCGPSANAAGGTAAWDTGLNWAVGSPTGPLQTYCAGSSVVFAGAPQNVAVTNAVSVSSISVLTDGWVFSGAAIELGGATGEVNIAAGTTTMLCGISGNLLKTGSGWLALPGGISACSSISVAAGVLNLGGTTAAVNAVTLTGGSLVGGVLNVADTLQLYSGTLSADITGTAALQKLGPNTVVLGGDNSYSGGTNAAAGTLIAACQASLPGAVSGTGVVIVQPTLYGSGSGDWTTCTWTLADGTVTGWIDGANVVIEAGADLSLSTSVNVSALTIQGNATIEGHGTLVLPAGGTTIDVLAGTATFDVGLAGGTPVKTGQGTADFLAPLATPVLVAGGQAIGPGAVFSGNESLNTLDPAMFSL